MRNFTLTQLITADVLQKIQDAFSDFTGMAALTTDAAGVPVTEGSNFINFCTNVVRRSEEGCRQCKKCDKNGALMAMAAQKPAIYRCHAGLVDFAAPIMVNGEFIGSFVGGQVLTDALDEELCRKKALSSLALHSYSKIEKSRSLELAARSQSDYIMSVFSEVATLGDDCLQAAREALDSDDHEQMKAALCVFARKNSAPTARIRDSITYIKSIGKKFRMSDEEYDPHKALFSVYSTLKNNAPEGTAVDFEISDDVPHLMLGDAGSMCQLIDKLVSVGCQEKSSHISISVSSSKHCYAEVLHIDLSAEGYFIPEADAKAINSIMSGYDDYAPRTQDDLDLSVIRSLLGSLSGSIAIRRTETGTKCRIDLPQLNIEGGDA